MTVEKEMFLGVDRKQVWMEMVECKMAVSSSLFIPAPWRGAKYCDAYVCLSVR